MMKTRIKIAICHLIYINTTLAVSLQRHLCKWVFLKLQNYQTCSQPLSTYMPPKKSHIIFVWNRFATAQQKCPIRLVTQWTDFPSPWCEQEKRTVLTRPQTQNSFNVVRSNSNIGHLTLCETSPHSPGLFFLKNLLNRSPGHTPKI